MSKKVAFFNESVSDTWLEYTLDGTTTTTTVGVAVSALNTTPSMSVPYFQADDANGVTDACAVIPSGNTATGKFQRADLSIYYKGSNDFISGGSHPPVRPS